jgi:nitrite reductase/ring-hydroxylating ferredoxin subunit
VLQAVGDGGLESEWRCPHQLAACFCMLALHVSQQRLARCRAAGAQFACFTGVLLVQTYKY